MGILSYQFKNKKRIKRKSRYKCIREFRKFKEFEQANFTYTSF